MNLDRINPRLWVRDWLMKLSKAEQAARDAGEDYFTGLNEAVWAERFGVLVNRSPEGRFVQNGIGEVAVGNPRPGLNGEYR